MPSGMEVQAVVIDSDGEMTPWEGLEPPKVESHQDLVKAAKASGLVGLGGAGFPAHIKLNVPEGRKIDTLIINVAECEPISPPTTGRPWKTAGMSSPGFIW